MNRSIRQLRIVLVALLAVLGIGVASVHAVAESELGQLTEETAPSGYVETTDASALSGDFTMEEFAQLTGQSIEGVNAADLREFAVFARTWDAADGSRLLILLVRTPSDAEAASFLAGILDSAGSAGYPTGVPGTVGRIIQGATPARIVAWRQGRYSVQIVSAAPTAEAAAAAAKQLAIDQVARLTPAVGEPGGEVESDKKGIAYALGGLVGLGAIVGLVVLVATRASKWQQGPPPPPPPPPPSQQPFG
ncbi:MAG: hypothetical protein ABMA25_22535 [Ilumatobacteraceae bacterium]